ncbi:MAG: zincin-like metallopeptidase domain-containing protein [Aestuariivita sp.]|nr:zincin-like metallopeptidase domain-containing protein [Aestuariivita sp.]MCY4345430.1 zincin-like metallopeptidase domain-containing protein [Aestuariivita sp.]
MNARPTARYSTVPEFGRVWRLFGIIGDATLAYAALFVPKVTLAWLIIPLAMGIAASCPRTKAAMMGVTLVWPVSVCSLGLINLGESVIVITIGALLLLGAVVAFAGVVGVTITTLGLLTIPIFPASPLLVLAALVQTFSYPIIGFGVLLLLALGIELRWLYRRSYPPAPSPSLPDLAMRDIYKLATRHIYRTTLNVLFVLAILLAILQAQFAELRSLRVQPMGWLAVDQPLAISEYGSRLKLRDAIRDRTYPNSLVILGETMMEAEDTATTKRKEQWHPKPKWWSVFNVEQIAGLPEHFYVVPDNTRQLGVEKDPKLDAFFAATGVEIVEHVDRAAYSPKEDRVFMPAVEKFADINQFYATLAHEMIHWTGAKHRLARPLAVKSTVEYAKEEVLAEIDNVYLCYQLGIKPDFPQSAAYIKEWKEQVKKSKEIIAEVATAARAATDYIISLAPELFEEIVKENTRKAEERSKMAGKVASPTQATNTRGAEKSDAKAESQIDAGGKTKDETLVAPSKTDSTDTPDKGSDTALWEG